MKIVPNVSADVFYFDYSISCEAIQKFNLNIKNTINIDNTDYRIDDPKGKFAIFIENGKIASVSIYDSCVFDGFEVIGLPIASIAKRWPNYKLEFDVPIEFENGDVHQPIDMDELGACFWCQNDIVLYVSVMNLK